MMILSGSMPLLMMYWTAATVSRSWVGNGVCVASAVRQKVRYRVLS